jgi:hypothetical protein
MADSHTTQCNFFRLYLDVPYYYHSGMLVVQLAPPVFSSGCHVTAAAARRG